MCLFVGELKLCTLIVSSSQIVKPICGQKSQEEEEKVWAQKRNATASVRAQKRKSGAQKSGTEWKSNRRITLTSVVWRILASTALHWFFLGV